MHSSDTPNSSTDSPSNRKAVDATPSDITAKDVWYHGELSEHEANNLLQGTAPGAFLVRQTASKRFYLSIVDPYGYPNHMPIRQLTSPAPHYVFEGKRFETLRDIIDAFDSAEFPVQKTKEDVVVQSKFLCTKSFERREVDEMSAEVGDVLTLCETEEPGWLLGRNETNRSFGLVPREHLEPLISMVEDLADLPYFYDTVAFDMVQYSPIGAFLLRRSSKGADTYALLVKTQFDLVEKFLIVGSLTRGFNLAGRPFPTVGHILTRYCDRPISGGVRLTHAVCIKHQKKSRRATAEVRFPAIHSSAQMSSSQYEDVRKEKTRRMFRGTSIDTALATASFLSNSTPIAMPSPANTVSTGIPEHLMDRFTDEDNNEHLVTTASSTVVASTVALRKSREEKQWKECWLTLSDTSGGPSHLAVYDSQQNAKLRQQIDLSTCTMYWLDESVFSADGCLFLSHSFTQHPTLFLCFRPFSTFLKWVRMIRARTIYQEGPPVSSFQGSSCADSGSTHVSMLSVEVDKFRSEVLKSDSMYSANLLINGVKVGSSSAFAPTGNKNASELPVVVIDSKFVIPFIPTTSTNIQLSIVAHSAAGKKGRPCGVSVTVVLNESTESVCQNPPETGFVFRAQLNRSPVLSIDRYRPLLEAIRESPSTLLSWPSQVLPQHLKVLMYSCISHLYAVNPTFMGPVISRIIDDVLATSTPEDVFRKDSLATGIMTQCLRHLFKTPFDEFLHENSTFSQACKQSNGLDSAIELLVNFVDQRLMTIPLATRLLVLASQCAKLRFGDEEPHLVKRTLSALLILRVLNPIIFSTLSSGGIGSQIAKSVQMCANSAASQSTNESLSPSAVTIRRIFDRMIILIDQQKTEQDERGNQIEGEFHPEWLSCLAHLIGHSLTLKSPVSATTSSEEVHTKMPLTVLELVRLHQ